MTTNPGPEIPPMPESEAPSPKRKENAVSVRAARSGGPLMITDMDSGWRLAAAFAASGMLPKSYAGSIQEMTAKAFTAMQMGAELGLMPMQSIQSIAVINGMPSLWGDAQRGIVLNHPDCEDVEDLYEGEWKGRDNTDPSFMAVCIVKRKGRTPVRREYSIQDAMDAGLWQTEKVVTKYGQGGKPYTKDNDSAWYKHPKRMLNRRAAALAHRDAFSDALKGLGHIAEEIIDITPVLEQEQRAVKPTLQNLLRKEKGEDVQKKTEESMELERDNVPQNTDEGLVQGEGNGGKCSEEHSGAESPSCGEYRPAGMVLKGRTPTDAGAGTEEQADKETGDGDIQKIHGAWDRRTILVKGIPTQKTWKNPHQAGEFLLRQVKTSSTRLERESILKENLPLINAMMQEGHQDDVHAICAFAAEGWEV